ncbi:MAG: glycoside hydrolase family 16 protein [Bacteroidota bacterium]|nr:glycoside hydrolase family 16 protein [Bacteroidota bacterium]
MRRWFRKLIVSVGIFLLTFLQSCHKNDSPVPSSNPITGCGYDLDETRLTSTGWTKVFEDNFTGDLANWNIWKGGAYNNELQLYQGNNLVISDGVLHIIARKENVTGPVLPSNPALSGFTYSSGRIESKFNISANQTTPKVRIIARLKLPTGYGMWPAFWSYGDPWPTMGEIDYMEARGNEPNRYLTNYYYGDVPGTIFPEDATGTITSNDDLTRCYHVYEIEWTQHSLNSYLDGNLVETKKKGKYIADLFGKTERIVLNLAVGGGFFPGLDKSLIQTDSLSVDWVKVFTAK